MKNCAVLLQIALCLSASTPLRGQSGLDSAAAMLEQGKANEAEYRLRGILERDPGNLQALILMGAALDSQQHYQDAEQYYQRALKLAPRSAAVLNNLVNHYLAMGERKRARELYLRAAAIDPHHANANLQLAQMSVDNGDGRQALEYLRKLSGADSAGPAMELLRSRALGLAGRCGESAAILSRLDAADGGDSRARFSMGMAFATCKLYGRAETSFTRALEADPRNFDILYNLGLAALRAGHVDRAAEALTAALTQRPDDPDALYAFSEARLKQQRPAEAAALLTRAQKAAPERADILLSLAQVASQLGFYEDSAATYGRYLRLKPSDDAARRERGFALACAKKPKSALPDLEWYARKHPGDAAGYYELAVGESLVDRARALALLDRAVSLDPGMIAARYTRAVLNIEEQRPANGVADLEIVVAREPQNYRALAHLGQAYTAAGQADRALAVLKRASAIAPRDPAVLL